jgi:hypothetical protein
MPALNPCQGVGAVLTNSSSMRKIYCEDALGWLQARAPLSGCSLVTSLPDVSEFSSMAVWREWFSRAAGVVLDSCAPEGVCIFYQTDVKMDGWWVDKGFLVQQAAEASGCALLWHKVVCRVPPGVITFGRPAWAHMLCFSREVRLPAARSTADVVMGGKADWARGMGLEACRLAVRFVREHTSSHTLVAPFCGTGLVLAVAEQAGLNAVGIELSRKRAKKAERQAFGD